MADDFSFLDQPSDARKKAEKALTLALDVRKFEIELYWKRATYFWAFLAVTLAGYVSVLTAKDIYWDDKGRALLVISCLGFVFSVAWHFVNRGSKFWQENWEKHVDLLEDEVNGPLYKTVMSRSDMSGWKPWHPYPFSVSKINQILSLFLALLFCCLTVATLCRYYTVFQWGSGPDGVAIAILILTALFVIALCKYGSTDVKGAPITAEEYQGAFGLKQHTAFPIPVSEPQSVTAERRGTIVTLPLPASDSWLSRLIKRWKIKLSSMGEGSTIDPPDV